jgi:hypothetical protein
VADRQRPLGGEQPANADRRKLGTTQPAAASINGEVDLLTYWDTGGMQEATLR